MMNRRRIIILAGALIAIVLLVCMLPIGPPVTLTFVGKTGRKYDAVVLLDYRLQNHRPWPIFFRGHDRISVRTDSGWQETNSEQYRKVFREVPTMIRPGGSTTIRGHAIETDTTNEARIGLDYYRPWDCRALWRWRSHPLSFPATVWSTPQHIGFADDPFELHIMVEEDGALGIAGTCVTLDLAGTILKKAFREYGRSLPILVASRKGADPRKVAPIVDLSTSIGFANTTLRTIDAPLGK
jgi:hypothetical protein